MVKKFTFLFILLLSTLSISAQQHTYIDASGPVYPRYSGTFELGITQTPSDDFRAEFLPSFGVKLNPYFYIGGGVGLNTYTNTGVKDGSDLWTLPIYANLRAFLPTGTNWFTPFLDMKPGYALGLNYTEVKGLYLSLAAGFSIKMVSLSFGYGHQAVSTEFFGTKVTSGVGGFSLKLGVAL